MIDRCKLCDGTGAIAVAGGFEVCPELCNPTPDDAVPVAVDEDETTPVPHQSMHDLVFGVRAVGA